MKKLSITTIILSIVLMGATQANAAPKHIFECFPNPTPDAWSGYDGTWASIFQDEFNFNLHFGGYDIEETDCYHTDQSSSSPMDCDKNLYEVEEGSMKVSLSQDSNYWTFKNQKNNLRISNRLVTEHAGDQSYSSYPATVVLDSKLQKLNCVKVKP